MKPKQVTHVTLAHPNAIGRKRLGSQLYKPIGCREMNSWERRGIQAATFGRDEHRDWSSQNEIVSKNKIYVIIIINLYYENKNIRLFSFWHTTLMSFRQNALKALFHYVSDSPSSSSLPNKDCSVALLLRISDAKLH